MCCSSTMTRQTRVIVLADVAVLPLRLLLAEPMTSVYNKGLTAGIEREEGEESLPPLV